MSASEADFHVPIVCQACLALLTVVANHTPTLGYYKKKAKSQTPVAGLEPATSSMEIRCLATRLRAKS